MNVTYSVTLVDIPTTVKQDTVLKWDNTIPSVRLQTP